MSNSPLRRQYAKDSGMDIGLYHDLAVATDSCGSDFGRTVIFMSADAEWARRPTIFRPKDKTGVSRRPMCWNIVPPATVSIVKAFGKFVNLGRRALRIDHVMRLFRLFWIPAGYGGRARYLRS